MKKSVLITVLLLSVPTSVIFARTNFSTSIGVKAQYGSASPLNYGIHYDIKKYLFNFNFDVETNVKVDKLFFDTLFGANLYVNNYVGSNYASFVVSLSPGVGVSIAIPDIRKHISIIPLLRLSLSFTTLNGFDIKLISDVGYDFYLVKPYSRFLYYKVGLAFSYSFNLEEEDYALKSIRYRE